MVEADVAEVQESLTAMLRVSGHFTSQDAPSSLRNSAKPKPQGTFGTALLSTAPATCGGNHRARAQVVSFRSCWVKMLLVRVAATALGKDFDQSTVAAWLIFSLAVVPLVIKASYRTSKKLQ